MTSCTTYIRGRRLRATKLDNCGRPIEGDTSVVTSRGMASVGIATNLQEGTEITVPNANGETLARVPGKPQMLGHTLTITLNQVDPELFTLLTGQELALDHDGKAVGFTTDDTISVEDVSFAFELWMGAPAGDDCDEEGSEGAFGYVLLPFVQGGVLGDLTVEDGAVSFTINSASTKTGNRWGVGHYAVVRDGAGDPALLPNPLKKTQHMLIRSTSVAPPMYHCGARPFLPAGDEAITDFTATDVALEVTFSPTPTGTDPFWVDFGDGTWDYSSTGADLVHTYEEAGTFTATMYRGIAKVDKEVTVTES